MPSLRQLRTDHAPLLILDAASARVQVGLLDRTDSAHPDGRWFRSGQEAGVALFEGVAQLAVDPAAAGAFVFCEGPGSILGIRTAAMAIRAWNVLRPRPVFVYQSLALVARALGRPDTGIVADARRDTWHRCYAGKPLERVPTASLQGDLAMPEGFRHWTPLPPGVRATPYDVAALFAATADSDLLRETSAPDAFLHEEPGYATWTPQIHRAPAVSPPDPTSPAR
jgi:tRNA threonylcarbamoyladenosine biosynthesis protein TsaB